MRRDHPAPTFSPQRETDRLAKIEYLAVNAKAFGERGPWLLMIRYHELLADLTLHVDGIINLIGLHVRRKQRQAAMALVGPNRNRFDGTDRTVPVGPGMN